MLGIDHFNGLHSCIARLANCTIWRAEVKGVVSFRKRSIILMKAITLMELLTRARNPFRINRHLSRLRALGCEKPPYR